MTAATYNKHHARRKDNKHESGIFVEYNPTYIPKHAKKIYRIYRVIGPGGPEETFDVYGIEEARKYILGCLDWEVTDCYGRIVDPRIVLYT